MSDNDACEKFPSAELPVWGKQGQWASYKQHHQDLQKELEETKKKLAKAEAELAERKQNDYDAVKAELKKLQDVLAGKKNLMVAGLKACADVTFTPKTP